MRNRLQLLSGEFAPGVPAILIPLMLTLGVLALVIGFLAAYWLGFAVITIGACITLVVIAWARTKGDALVVSVALIVFWLPFVFTFSRFNFSPQEIGTYATIITVAALDRAGVARWLRDVRASVTTAMQFALLLFALSCMQALIRLQHIDLVNSTYTLRSVLVFPAALGLLGAYTIHTRRAGRVLIQAFYAGAFFLAVYALSLRLLGVLVENGAVAGRLGAESSFLSQYHPNNIALYLTLALGFAPAILMDISRSWESSRFLKAIAYAATVIMGIALWLTYSRGAIVALGVGGIVLLLVMALIGRGRVRMISGVTLAVGVALIAVLAFSPKGHILGRYSSVLHPATLLSDPNVVFRLKLYVRALQIISGHVFTGIGLGGFASTGSVPFSPHDTYLDVWVSTGAFGVAALILAIVTGVVAAVKYMRRHERAHDIAGLLYASGYVLALVGFAIQAFVEAYDANPRIAPAIWFLVLASQAPVAQKVLARSAKSQSAATDDISGLQSHAGRQIPAALATDYSASSVLDWRWGTETGPLPIIDESAIVATAQRAIVRVAVDGENTSKAENKQASVSDEMQMSKPMRSAASGMLQRASTSYLWNQLYAIWTFGSGFILSVIITRGLHSQQYGIYAVLSSIISTMTFLFAMGLEDAATVFVPREVARDNKGAAGALMRQLLVQRAVVIGAVSLLLGVGFSAATPLLERVGALPSGFSQSGDALSIWRPMLMGAYLAGSSIVALQSTFFASLLRSRATLVVGGISQFLSILMTLGLIRLGYGVDGIFFAQACVSWLTVVIYLIALAPHMRGSAPRNEPGRASEMRKFMLGAWLTNVTNGALGKQMDILLMSLFAISFIEIGYYNLAYQLVSIISVLLISGLGGVGMAAMSAAYNGSGKRKLASVWRASIMLQLLMAIPAQALALTVADQIVSSLYGSQYAGATSLIRIYLWASIIGRMVGGGANQSALYVLGKQRSVVITRWIGLFFNVVLDITLIQLWGPAGALLATGFSQLWVGFIEYLLLRMHAPARYPIAFAQRVVGMSGLAAIVTLWWTPTGFIGLVVRSTVFVVVFVGCAILFGLGDSTELQEMINLNPRLRALTSRLSPSALLRRKRAGVLVSKG